MYALIWELQRLNDILKQKFINFLLCRFFLLHNSTYNAIIQSAIKRQSLSFDRKTYVLARVRTTAKNAKMYPLL
jgi:hypothetical protein